MVGRTWEPAEDATLRALHSAGRSLHSIAAEMVRSKRTISAHAADLGLTWDRSKTAAATQARVIDNKARRTGIVTRMYDRMEHLQDRLEAAEFRAVLKGANGVDETHRLDFVPTVDERNIADTLSRYTASATKLEAVDANQGAEHEKSLLRALGDAIGVAGPGSD